MTNPQHTTFTRFRAVAEHAVLIEFGEMISEDANAQVIHLDRALAGAAFLGFREAVPAYVSLLVEFDPLVTDHETVRQAIETHLSAPRLKLHPGTNRDVLACYDGDFAPDLAAVAEQLGMTIEAVIETHLSGDYRVFMYGFAPGYAYLAGVPAHLQLPRKPAATRAVPAGSVLIAGPQCLVSTLTMPTGWWIIGRSPTRILGDNSDRPFLFDVGDRVTFRRIDRSAFHAQLAAG